MPSEQVLTALEEATQNLLLICTGLKGGCISKKVKIKSKSLESVFLFWLKKFSQHSSFDSLTAILWITVSNGSHNVEVVL